MAHSAHSNDVAYVLPSSGTKVFIYKGDITTLKVDVIVNSTDANMSHGSGVAKAIIEKGGNSILQEGKRKFRELGHFETGDNIVGGPGKLPCKHIFHAVGPEWSKYSPDKKSKCTDKLYKTYYNCFKNAVEIKASSIAMPAISAGTFAVPRDLVVNCLWKAMTEYDTHTTPGGHALNQIHVVDINDAMITAFVTGFTERGLQRDNSQPNSGSGSSSTASAAAFPSTSDSSGMTSLQQELRTLKDEKTCKVCLNEPVTTMFLPCGHLACCNTCSGSFTTCPICRATITKKQTAYFA